MNIYKYAQLIGTVCGGLLIGLPVISHAVMAQEITANVNPCPKIFYEEPHNNRVLVPTGCPPNALTLKLIEQGLIPVTPLSNQIGSSVGGESPSALNPSSRFFNESPYDSSQRSYSFQPGSYTLPQKPLTVQSRLRNSRLKSPAPEQRQQPNARMALANGKANIMLINDTGADVTYQVIGDTAQRILSGKTSTNLRGLSTPVTVTFQRQDKGLLMVTPKVNEDKGTLEVTLAETTDVNQDNSAMRIQANGSVFLN
ncbi:hypothetical protein VB713_18680 [Anabaena cylindrica UHCC 0172]|uniref:hypothetical protein n=1 Tax=Anabaena cylindrica TaxID=1165 RepID=UPI002B1EB644|nr:hypothetical protein [Anabaena cylindrica]MEA5552974.1 hypothetical protein [Anabaena cylindrica UHCC 0172]